MKPVSFKKILRFIRLNIIFQKKKKLKYYEFLIKKFILN